LAEAAVEVEHGLKRELRLRDLVPMQILLVVGITWSGIAAKQGSMHPVVWIVGVLFFFLPQVAVVTYCARLWPLEGGVYQWTKFAFGPLIGFLAAWNYALYVIYTVSGIGIQVATSLGYALGPRAAWIADSHAVTFALDILLFGIMLAVNIPGMRLGRWVSNFGTAMMAIVVLTLAVLLVWHPGATAAHPHVSPQAPFAFAWPVMSLLTLNLYVKVAFNAYGGLEQVAVFAGETRNAGRAIMLSAWIAAPAIVVIYALMTGSMLTYVPSTQIDLAGPIPQVIAAALGQGTGVWLGRAMILGLTIFLVCSFTILIAETSRLPMVAGWDSILPAWFTKLNPRYRTPVRSLCVIVGIAAISSFLASLNVGRQEAFQLIQNSGNLCFGFYYAVMFAVPLVVGSRFGRRPGFWLLLCAVSGLAVTVAQTFLATVPIVEVHSTWAFAAKLVAAWVVTNVVGLAIYWRGRRLLVSR
jgi:glutamate:GABA antiporter